MGITTETLHPQHSLLLSTMIMTILQSLVSAFTLSIPASALLVAILFVAMSSYLWYAYSQHKSSVARHQPTFPAKPYNTVENFNPDFWFPIPLMDNNGKELAGRLWTTRCPRKVLEGGARHFEKQVRDNEVTRVLTLIEEHEDTNTVKRAGAPLEPYYASLGLRMDRFEMPDWEIPEGGLVMTTKMLLTALRNGEHAVVHCGSGNGRAGMILAALYRMLGVSEPIEKLRTIREYVDTPEQAKYIMNIEL